MTQRLAVLHTSFVFINVEKVFTELYKELIPDVEIVDFVDSHILADLRKVGTINKTHIQRMTNMALAAQASGADIIFSACSSLGPSIDFARQMVDTPIIKIDDPMTQKAVELGKHIGVMATVPTTLPPTIDLLHYWAGKQEKTVSTQQVLCEGAFESLMSGDRAKHDAIVEEKARALAQQVDIIVLAQASMSRLAPDLTIKTGKQVLGSPRLAVEYIKKCFDDPQLLK